ncbi:GNAT family N-acetyltransferase [Danxiaibacter flavus]|uniref:GNAT family N-acetyltransferase n=1 Tax=Danxiaibacter flavus TaxID=3049108 RepID=A0ABV3ZDR8_9BACT|nr:GNAT family N-acetyltransferase [Chitinophagaceae bacterium DXS]
MKIRKATTDDIPAIQQIAKDTWPDTYSGIISQEQIDYMLNLMYNTQTLTEQMSGDHHFFIAEQEDKPIGFAGCSPYSSLSPQRWKLHKLYVLPTIQRSGAGKALSEAVVDVAKTNGATELVLNVNKNNPAYTYYLKHGFTVLENMILDIGNGYVMDDYVLIKQI